MKKVLIFGVAGFVGKYLAKEFCNAGYEVFGSDILEKNETENVVYAKADLLNDRSVSDIILEVKPDMIINLAAVSSVGLSWKIPQITMSVNVIGALNILEAAKQLSFLPKVMFIGSSEEYDISDKPIDESFLINANNPYGISKVAQERFAELYRERYGMKVYCVRPFNHTGVGQNDAFVLPSFCKQAAEIEKSGKPGTIRVGNLSAKRDFSHVKDIVRAYRMIIENDDCKTIYNVGSGKAYGLDEMLDYIISLCHQKITVVVDPERFRPVDTPVICCDNTLIHKRLGWHPETSVYEALKELYNDYYRRS